MVSFPIVILLFSTLIRCQVFWVSLAMFHIERLQNSLQVVFMHAAFPTAFYFLDSRKIKLFFLFYLWYEFCQIWSIFTRLIGHSLHWFLVHCTIVICVYFWLDKKVIIDTSSRTFYIDIHEINSDIITSQSNLGITQRTCSYQKR